jgi:hypothetical protein
LFKKRIKNSVFPGKGEERKKAEPTLPRPPVFEGPEILNKGVFITRRETDQGPSHLGREDEGRCHKNHIDQDSPSARE